MNKAEDAGADDYVITRAVVESKIHPAYSLNVATTQSSSLAKLGYV